MNRRLRELHRGAFYVLAVAVPTLFVAALWQRGPTGAAAAARGHAADGATLWPEEGLAVELRRGDDGGPLLAVWDHGKPVRPGRVLYWSDREAGSEAALPDGAVALDSAELAGRGAPVPTGGFLLAYDVAQQRVRSALALPEVQER